MCRRELEMNVNWCVVLCCGRILTDFHFLYKLAHFSTFFSGQGTLQGYPTAKLNKIMKMLSPVFPDSDASVEKGRDFHFLTNWHIPNFFLQSRYFAGIPHGKI